MMNAWHKQELTFLIQRAHEEDLGRAGDITSTAIFPDQQKNQTAIIARQQGVICGVEIGQWVLQMFGADASIQVLVQDGAVVDKGSLVATFDGRTIDLLRCERTILNFMGRLSGIATTTFHFVQAIKHTRARILDTRKTTPGWRYLEKYAVKCGGGENHRMGLFDMFLIKDNHIAAAGSIIKAVQGCRAFMAEKQMLVAIEVEAKTIAEVEEAMALHVDRIMLDNMSLDMMKAAVKLVANRIPLEASGGVSLKTVAAIAETGVDYISVGALTHSAQVLDLSMEIMPN
jgi:nicotinate-nucleotide pyrophosphorylase (carboxylating)